MGTGVFNNRSIMADNIVISEVLSFVKLQFGSVSAGSIQTVIATFFNDDELSKAKAVIYGICVKCLPEGSISRIIARKGDNI